MIENKYVEFKRMYTDQIKYSILAFGNSDGGKIYIGVEDDGHVCGIENIDDTILRVTHMIRDNIKPDIMMFVNIETQMMEGKSVVVVSVQRGTNRPYYLASKGIRPEGVYVRQGASSVPASEYIILDLIKETSGDRYEIACSLNQQLSFEDTRVFFEKKNIEFKGNQMKTLQLINEEDIYTNLGLLLSDQNRHSIKLAVFEGDKKSIFKDRHELFGSLFTQLEDAYTFLDRYNRTRSEFDGLYRIDFRDYPEEALREALLNAIVHRDYAMSSSTLISIFDDRIEFLNVGGLVGNVSYNDIMLGVSVLRNQNLANIFYRLHLIEAYGTGILKIKECYEDCEVKPMIQVSDHAFKLTLPNRNYYKESKVNTLKVSSLDTREDKIILLAKKQETITRKDVETLLNVSQPTAVLIIREMIKKGILTTVSGGKYVKYRLI